MRVLQINANYGFGSTGLIMKDIGQALSKSGHDAYFAYQNTNQEIKNGYRIGNVFDWKCHAIACRVFGKQGYYSKKATVKLLNHIKEINPDVVHLHNLHSNYVNINMLLEYLAINDIATVITMHDCWYFTGKCFHYVDSKCDRFQYGCGQCKKKNAPPISIFFDCSKKVLQDKKRFLMSIPRLKIVGCSQWICNEAKKSILKKRDICCIYNGVDTAIFCRDQNELRQKLKLENEFVVMGMANKWLLPENIIMVEKVSSLPDVRLLIVGCNKKQIKMLSKISTDIISVGYIKERKKLAEFYNSADVFVNLTHADTLPTVNMESICCGTPVITYDSCGSPELVDDESGVIVKEYDEEGIINAILKMQNQSYKMRWKNNIEKFDKNYCYEKYVDLYSTMLK